jgi:hypothetical protein
MKLPRTLTLLIGFTGAAFAHQEEELTSANASVRIDLSDDDRNDIQVTLHDDFCIGDNAAVRQCSLNISDHAEVDEACDIYGGSLVQGRQIYNCEAHGSALKLELFDKFGCTLERSDVIDSVRVDGLAVAFERIGMSSGIATPLWYSTVAVIATFLLATGFK